MSNATTSAAPPANAGTDAVGPATYTVADVARLLGCSERHVWRQIDLQRIPGILRVGRLVRMSRKLVDEWLTGNPARRRD
jgi:excisionase family DNA binding protein